MHNNSKRIYALLSALLIITQGYLVYETKAKNKNSLTNKDLNNIQTSTEETIATSIYEKDLDYTQVVDKNLNKVQESLSNKIVMPTQNKGITLSFIGDCTIGSDPTFGYQGTFNQVFDKNNHDYSYFFKKVKQVLINDDLTIANLETTFTNETKEKVKTFNFKGDPSYVNILKRGSVEVVNVANNHIYDYLNKGYNDTISTLNKGHVNYYGYQNYLIKEVDGIKIGIAGFNVLNGYSNTYVDVKRALDFFKKEDVKLKIITFHWGIERNYHFNNEQQKLAHYTIDNGADLIVGHHPHVLQGAEEYMGKYIFYSLGNFVFGGNKNPSDKDSVILQYNAEFSNKLVKSNIKLIPVSISSTNNYNDYQPHVLEEPSKSRVLKKIYRNSYNYKEND